MPASHPVDENTAPQLRRLWLPEVILLHSGAGTGSLSLMSSVPTHLRARIDAAAHELISIAEKLGPDHKILADLYAAFGAGILSTHKKRRGAMSFGSSGKCVP